jgi:hypothetical protein
MVEAILELIKVSFYIGCIILTVIILAVMLF